MDEQTQRLTKVMELRASQERAAERAKSVDQRRRDAEAFARSPEGVEARRQELNELWAQQYDKGGPLRRITTEECGERDRLNRAHAEREKQKAAAPQPRTASSPGRKTFAALTNAAAKAVGREINELRRERELNNAKVDAALARLEAAIARVEAKG